MSTLRRIQRAQRGKEAISRFNESIEALKSMGGLQESIEGIKALEALVREAEGVFKRMSHDQDVQREVFIRMLAQYGGGLRTEAELREIEGEIRAQVLKELE